MGNCRDCKHWVASSDGSDNPLPSQGTCQKIEGAAGCQYPETLPVGVLAQVQASYDYTGCAFPTRADFGCVLFEGK